VCECVCVCVRARAVAYTHPCTHAHTQTNIYAHTNLEGYVLERESRAVEDFHNVVVANFFRGHHQLVRPLSRRVSVAAQEIK